MRLLFLTLLFFNNAFSLNPIDHFYRQYVNHSSDPCDNFYRHACPIGTPSFFIARNIKKKFELKFDALLNSTTIITDRIDLKDLEEDIARTRKLLKSRCEEGKSLNLLLEHLQLPDHLKEEKDCDRLDKILVKYGGPSEIELIELQNFIRKLKYRTKAYSFIRVILDNDLEDAVIEMKEIFKALVNTATEWVLETPWVANFDQTKLIQKVLKNMAFVDDYEGLLKELTEKMLTLEIFYRNCKAQYDNIIESSFICFQQTMKNDATGPEEMLEIGKLFWFSLGYNGFNLHSQISIGNVYFQVLKDTTEMAAKLGAAGWVAGHEASHSLIADKFDKTLPYFSEKSVECIQNQFNKTCTEFKEQSCIVKNDQVDENGSDILGMQLVHDLLEKHYNETLNDIYEPLKITYHQLFFYAHASMGCEGELQTIRYRNDGNVEPHSTKEVRINVVAQHPGFQKAFNCPDDSRMMQSATEQCIIYGKNAPKSKRRI